MRDMVCRPLALSLIGAALVASGCGATTVRHVTTTITRPTTAAPPGSSTATTGSTSSTSSATTTATGTTSTAPPAASARSKLAGRSPRAIVAAAAGALRDSGGYVMRADLRESGEPSLLALTADGPRRFQATLTDGGVVTGLIGLPSASYLRGNIAFWRGHDGTTPQADARAKRLAGHWLKLTPRGASSVIKTLGSLSPAVLARCLVEDHGTLSLAGHTTIGHIPAIVIRDAGNAPGATPSTIAVAASGPPYPLRYTATGPTRAGGRIDVCNDGKGDDSEGTISFDQFGQVPNISAPTGVRGGAAV
jgi:hypothetical protein